MDMEKCNKNVQKIDSEVGTSLSLDSDASIADFKSPKIKPIEKLKLFNFKLTKKKETSIKTELSKGLNKKAGNQLKKNISDVHIRTESNICEDKSESVKHSNDTKVAYVCPLCFKNFKDTNSRILHMKNCAAKNNVSMEKLLQAMELQERQSAERVSLGLLAAPVLQNKKQTTINKMDHQLQLALALSKSLYEAEEVGNYNEIEDLADICPTKDSTKELMDKNLMGNITTRFQKKKKQTFITVLQTRSKEERDRLITEKIAEILIDSETLHQSQQQMQSKFENIKRNNLRSHILKKYLNFDNKLWNSAMLQLSQKDFYVITLSPYIIPSTKQTFMESESESNMSNKSEQKVSSPTKSNLHSNKKESSNISHKVDINLFPNTEKENINIQSSINTLILDWGNALNNSSSSDIIIFVNDSKHIWVHKLVFYIRCSNILLDIIPNNDTTYSVKEMICWIDVEYHIALAFLEFIYCGIIKKHAISFNDNIAISSLGRLARRYKVKELFTYLRLEYAAFHDRTSKNDKFELYKQDIQEDCNSNDKQNEFVEYNTLTPKEDINSVNCNNQSIPDISIMEISPDKLLKTSISPEKCVTLVDRKNSMSPDIFNDTSNDVILNRTNMEILLSPIQCSSKNTTNQILFSSSINKSRSSTDECALNQSPVATPKNNPNIMENKIKSKSNLTLFIEEIQRENAKSDFASDSEIDSPIKSFIQYNKNPFRKKNYDESNVLDKLHNSKLSSDRTEKKENGLSKLEKDMQIHADDNPQLYNITVDKNLTTSTEHNHTDLFSSIKEIETSMYSDNNISEKTIASSQINNASVTTSLSSNSEMDTDDLNMYTKNKRKYIDKSIAVYQSASKKYKNTMTEIKNDEVENNKAIASNSDKVDEDEIYDTLLNNSFKHKDNFKEQDIDNCNNDSSKIQITNNESFNNDYSNIFNLVSPEISDIENQNDSPFKLSTNPDSVVISSSPDIDINSQDINNFNKNDSLGVLSSKIQESDDELHYTFPNDIHFSNINIDNRIEHITLNNKTLQICSRNKKLRKRCKSEGNLQINYTAEENDKLDKFNNMNSLQCNKEDNKLIIKNKLFTITENNDILPPNYDIMDTAELHREMQKYGLKIQNRNKNIKLLTYIYKELHPTIETIDTSGKNMYNEYEGPQKKRLKVDINLSDKYSNIERECNVSSFKNWNSNDYSRRMETKAEYMNNVENLIALSDCDSIKEAFSKLIEFNKDLHNKILQYEPLNIELLHHMLKTNGFKCKINALIDFLDEQVFFSSLFLYNILFFIDIYNNFFYKFQ
ncbi:uncharacterized protein MAL8P1.12-like isoform X2 [Vespa velutina]|uniref:uncharacterized protein MAL8P1.12-like isoform X2 n=1 Tax=Vespa velutina TaxID=202808 RepID=UPI001FB3FF3B|nr:uncharacterized protein MAL8P1.12-like isoform X2 [Vespa velutina]